MAVSSEFFCENIVAFAQETQGCSHSSPVNEPHYHSVSNCEGCVQNSMPLVTQTRFHLSSEEEIKTLSLKQVPKKTQDATKWVLTTFNTWRESHNLHSSVKCPTDIFDRQDSATLNYWLKIFAVEVRKVNGEQYPPKTLYLMFSAILRYMRSINPEAPNILAKNNPAFSQLHNTLDGIFKKLRAEGVGATSKNAEPFTKEEENKLWKSGVMMGTDSPQALLNSIFFYNGKGCCLRGGEEHRNLRVSQFQRVEGGYIYTENASKNRSGGFAQLNIANKSVKIMRCYDAGERCHCYLLDQYFKRIPSGSNHFYLRPLPKRNIKQERILWFSSVPIGRNKLATIIKDMCKCANTRSQNKS